MQRQTLQKIKNIILMTSLTCLPHQTKLRLKTEFDSVPSPGFEPGNRRPKRRVISVSPRGLILNFTTNY